MQIIKWLSLMQKWTKLTSYNPFKIRSCYIQYSAIKGPVKKRDRVFQADDS